MKDATNDVRDFREEEKDLGISRYSFSLTILIF